MSTGRQHVENAAIGVGAFIIIVVALMFAPSLMTTLSIVDIFYDTSGYVNDEEASNSVTAGIFIFIGLATIQACMTAAIRVCWLPLILWWILSIHPFIYFVIWIYASSATGEPWPGIDWLPYI